MMPRFIAISQRAPCDDRPFAFPVQSRGGPYDCGNYDKWDGAHWSHYDTNDGLAGDDCNLNGFSEEPDGTVWIGTSSGLSRFKPRSRALPEEPLHVVFTRLFMGPKDVTTQIKSSSAIHENSLLARYSALDASRKNHIW
jgi:hypothetical protein